MESDSGTLYIPPFTLVAEPTSFILEDIEVTRIDGERQIIVPSIGIGQAYMVQFYISTVGSGFNDKIPRIMMPSEGQYPYTYVVSRSTITIPDRLEISQSFLKFAESGSEIWSESTTIEQTWYLVVIYKRIS